MWRIGELGAVVTGRTPPAANPELFGSDLPFLTPTDIDGVSRYVETGRSLSASGAEVFSRILLPSDAVCCVCIGATIGKICLTKKKSVTNQQINSIIVDTSRHDPKYIFYKLLTMGPIFKAHAGGAATPIVNKSQFSDVEIELLDLEGQQNAARILSVYDDLIENNARRIAILEEMARRIFEEWFVHFRAPGCEGLPLVESELGPIPKGWKATTLRNIADDLRDPADPRMLDPSTPYVGLEHIPRRSTTFADWGASADVTSLKLKFRRGDILFGKIRPYFHKSAVAPVDGVASSDAIIIRPKTARVRALVTSVASSDAFVAHAVATSNGTKMPRADWKVLRVSRRDAASGPPGRFRGERLAHDRSCRLSGCKEQERAPPTRPPPTQAHLRRD
jgi:type I restriction enzyme S subunit